MPTRCDTLIGACSARITPVWRQSHAPAMAPKRMATSCENEDVLSNTMSAATAVIEALSRSGQSVRAMPQTAWATIATATSLSPCNNPVPIGPLSELAAYANNRSATAEGSVNPAQAASPPRYPARRIPMEKPTLLLVGPGANWQRATNSA